MFIQDTEQNPIKMLLEDLMKGTLYISSTFICTLYIVLLWHFIKIILLLEIYMYCKLYMSSLNSGNGPFTLMKIHVHVPVWYIVNLLYLVKL